MHGCCSSHFLDSIQIVVVQPLSACQQLFNASCRYTGHTLAKFFVTLATGLVTGLTAAATAGTLETVFALKQRAVQSIIDVVHHRTLLAAFGLHLGITTVLLMFAACLVRFYI